MLKIVIKATKEKNWVLGGNLIFNSVLGQSLPVCHMFFANPKYSFLHVHVLTVVLPMYPRRSQLCKNWLQQVAVFPVWMVIGVVSLPASSNWRSVCHCWLIQLCIYSSPGG